MSQFQLINDLPKNQPKTNKTNQPKTNKSNNQSKNQLHL